MGKSLPGAFLNTWNQVLFHWGCVALPGGYFQPDAKHVSLLREQPVVARTRALGPNECGVNGMRGPRCAGTVAVETGRS